MARIISTNITSPLGQTTEETYQAVRSGMSGLRQYPCWKELPFPITASLFAPRHTFEEIVLHSVRDALSRVDIEGARTIFILSSTKGDVENLDPSTSSGTASSREVTPLGEIAKSVSEAVGIPGEPIAVCNACISGLSAIILGQRLVDSGYYDYAVVCGADIQSRFVVSGFQSLKALSPEECRPFDIERLGLNLGEAAATMVIGNVDPDSDEDSWSIVSGAVRNDAYHISAPHPKGDGAYSALRATTHYSRLTTHDSLACIGVHGTATMYNDQMESKAIERAGMQDVPLSALKGYFGHTMGAAGVLETIITARALDDGIILPSRNYDTRGVSGKVTLSSEEIETDKHAFIKMLSGFGGCNAAVLVDKGQSVKCEVLSVKCEVSVSVVKEIDRITLSAKENGKALLKELYKQHVGDYPKFYKMDVLSRLAFILSELLLKDKEYDEHTAVILFNRTSSIVSDKAYEASIQKDDFFPSPSVFVYTLPNIAIGEIVIRHGFKGETSFYILREKNENLMKQVVSTTFEHDPETTAVITGWIDCPTDDEFECELKIYHKQ